MYVEPAVSRFVQVANDVGKRGEGESHKSNAAEHAIHGGTAYIAPTQAFHLHLHLQLLYCTTASRKHGVEHLVAYLVFAMSFWGVEVKPRQVVPFVPPPEQARLHISQVCLASLGERS